jgi:hypothetical protein
MHKIFSQHSKKKIPLAGLSVEKSWVRCVVLGWEKGHLSVKKNIEYPVPEEASLFESFFDWVKLLKNLVEEASFPKNVLINCTLPITHIFLETLHFPELPQRELEKALEWEVKRRFKVAWDKICCDSFRYESNERSSTPKVSFLVSAALNQVIKRFLRILHHSRIGAACIEPPQVSLLRGVGGPYGSDYRPVTLFYADGTILHRLMVSEEEYIFTDTVSSVLGMDNESIGIDSLLLKDNHWFWAGGESGTALEIRKRMAPEMKELPPLNHMWNIKGHALSLKGWEIPFGLALRELQWTLN